MSLDRTYTLDSNIALGNNTVKITIKSYFDPDAGIIGYFEEKDKVPELITKVYENDGINNVYYDNHESYFLNLCEVYHDSGKIYFFNNAKYPTYLQGEDNIEVEFQTRDVAAIGGYDILTIGGKTVIGYDKYNDTILFSEYDNIGYFPLNNYIKAEVNSAYPIGDNIIALFTNNGVSYLKRNTITLGENNVKYAYSYIEGKPGITCCSENSVKSLANDILFLSDVGVHSLSFGDNITSNERYALERSGFINSKLVKEKNLKSAQAITHKNKYYLAIGDKVYVCDARYKSSARDEDMKDTFNYEWWYWDNMDVKKWFIYNDKLFFISSSGYIAELTERRVDEKILLLSQYDNSNGLFSPVINDYYLFQLNMEYVDWLQEGNLLMQTQKYSSKEYIISDVNKFNGTFKLKDAETNEYITNDIYFFGKDETQPTEPVYLYTKYKLVYIVKRANVVSEWYTPMLNMGTSLYSKNLVGSTLTFEPDVEGNVKFGYLTRRSGEPKDKPSNLSPTTGVDLEDLDFTDFSFSVGFACSRTLKTRVRNYNYIQFRIISDDDKDCALNNFVVTYTIGRKNKGVR